MSKHTEDSTGARAEHTPGPWWRDDDGFIAAGSGDTYVTIADFDCSDDLSIDEREANKTLAIAAPELLAALIAVQSDYRDLFHHSTDDDEKADIEEMLDIVDAAIAKARGQ